jgi:hypothetical protein
MRFRLFLTCMIASSLAATVVSAEPKAHKRHRTSVSTTVRPEPKNPCADPYVVCWAGTYIGRDPDPRVRSQLLWDFGTNGD